MMTNNISEAEAFRAEIQKVTQDLTQYVGSARALAQKAHEGQIYDGKPFVDGHLDRVAAVMWLIVEPMFLDKTATTELLCATYLHDVLEDTSLALAEIQMDFGREISRLVYAVTDEPGANRRERKAKTYEKIRLAGSRAVLLKLADRIANVEASIENGQHKFLEMYRTEHGEFEEALRRPLEFPHIWDYLNRLLKEG